MPASTAYIPLTALHNNNSPAKKLWDEYTKELNARRARIKRNRDYYDGNMTDVLYQAQGSKLKSNIKLPLCQMLIDRSVTAMMGTDDTGNIEGVQFEAVDPNPTPETQSRLERVMGAMNILAQNDRQSATPDTNPIQEILDSILQANRKNRLLHDFFQGGAFTGHFAVRIFPDAIEHPDDPSQLLPRIVSLDMSLVSVFWKADDADTVLWYRIDTGADKARRIEDIVRVLDDNGNTLRWDMHTYTPVSNGNWQLDSTTPWNHKWSPIVDGQNLPRAKAMGYYGGDELGMLPDMNDALNFLASNALVIQKSYGSPITVAKGVELGTDENGDPNPLDIAPGAVLEVNADGDIYVVEVKADNAAAFRLVEYLQSSFFAASRQVDPATIKDKLGDLTNFGLRILYGDALQKRNDKWLDAGEVLKQAVQRALLLATGQAVKVNITPAEMLPSNIAETAHAMQTAQTFGLSSASALTKLGFDPTTEEDKRQREIGVLRATTARLQNDRATNEAITPT